MKLRTTTFVSVDGVMQGIGAPEEDRRGGFDRGGWTTPMFDAETAAYLDDIYGRAQAFLFGRWTYEVFAASWGQVADPNMNTIAKALHDLPKYIASTGHVDSSWAHSTLLSGDLETAIVELKTSRDGDLIVPGSGNLIRWLLSHNLVDQIDLLTFPVVIGQGTRLFPEKGPDIALEPIDAQITSRGINIQSYRPAGSPQYAVSTADLKHINSS